MLEMVAQLTVVAGPDIKGVLVSKVLGTELITGEQFQAALINLQALRILERKFEGHTILMGGVPFARKSEDLVGLTFYGKQFARVICGIPFPNA